MTLSDLIDEGYEDLLLGQMTEESLDDDNEIGGSIGNSHENDSSMLTQSKMRFGKVDTTECLNNASTQTDQDLPQAVKPKTNKHTYTIRFDILLN